MLNQFESIMNNLETQVKNTIDENVDKVEIE